MLDNMLKIVQWNLPDETKYTNEELEVIGQFIINGRDFERMRASIIPFTKRRSLRLYASSFDEILNCAGEETDGLAKLGRFFEVTDCIDKRISWCAVRTMAPRYSNLWEFFEGIGNGYARMLDMLCANESVGICEWNDTLDEALETSLANEPGGGVAFKRRPSESVRPALVRHICENKLKSVHEYAENGGRLQALAILYSFGGRKDLLPELVICAAAETLNACNASGLKNMQMQLESMGGEYSPVIVKGVQEALMAGRDVMAAPWGGIKREIFCIAQELLNFECEPVNGLFTLLCRMYPREMLQRLCTEEANYGHVHSEDFRQAVVEMAKEGKVDDLSAGAAILCDVDLRLYDKEDECYQKVEDTFNFVNTQWPGRMEEMLVMHVDAVYHYGHTVYSPTTRDLNLLYYARFLWQRGQALHLVPIMEKSFLNIVRALLIYAGGELPLAVWDKTLDYLAGKEGTVSEVAKMDLPTKGMSYSREIYCAAGLLVGYSYIPRQFIIHSLAQKLEWTVSIVLDAAYPYYNRDIMAMAKALMEYGFSKAEVAFMYQMEMEKDGRYEQRYLNGTMQRYKEPLTQGSFRGYFTQMIQNHPEEAVESLRQVGNAKFTAWMLRQIYDIHPNWNHALLLEMMEHKAKMVRQQAAELLARHSQLEEEIKALAQSKKKAVRECAEQVIMLWGKGIGAVPSGENGNENPVEMMLELRKKLYPIARVQLRWLKEKELPKVHWKSGAEAETEELRAYVYSFYRDGAQAIAPALQSAFQKDEMLGVMREVLGQWLEDGAPLKSKNILFMFAVHADNILLAELQELVNTWGNGARAALAAQTITAMAYSDNSGVLPFLEQTSMRHKSRVVQAAAVNAMEFIAQRRGITADELGDMLISNLGFDAKGSQTFTYGTRAFVAWLTPALGVELLNEEGKPIKALPAPGKKDDQTLAAAEKERFSSLKKELKELLKRQNARLTMVLATGRTWQGDTWKKLFVDNPIMHIFAMGLVWGEYVGDEVKATFRYQNDHTFTTANESAYQLAENAVIGLVHPLELDSALLGAWKQQLEDYEVAQPIPQLERVCYHPEKEEASCESLERFAGANVPGVILSSTLQKLGWMKAPTQDGCQYIFYKEYRGVELLVELLVSGLRFGDDLYKSVTLFDICFFTEKENKRSRVTVGSVPARLFSEVCVDVAQVAEGVQTTNQNWQEVKKALEVFED